MGADFDMELLLCALQHYQLKGAAPDKLCHVCPILFTEVAESQFMATSGDPDKPYKTYADMTQALLMMHQRYIPAGSAEAKAAAPLVKFCKGMTWQTYKNMILKLEKDNGPTLFDKDFSIGELKAAAAWKPNHQSRSGGA